MHHYYSGGKISLSYLGLDHPAEFWTQSIKRIHIYIQHILYVTNLWKSIYLSVGGKLNPLDCRHLTTATTTCEEERTKANLRERRTGFYQFRQPVQLGEPSASSSTAAASKTLEFSSFSPCWNFRLGITEYSACSQFFVSTHLTKISKTWLTVKTLRVGSDPR